MPSKSTRTRKEIADANAELRARAASLYADGMPKIRVASELQVHFKTVEKWLKEAGVRPPGPVPTFKKKKSSGPNTTLKQPPLAEYEDDGEAVDPLDDALKQEIAKQVDLVSKVVQHDARIEEDGSLLEIAEAQSTPADKYQHYIAAAAIKLLRDSMANLKGPKTVRELSELDQLIRRNLGLNAKSGGGQSKMHIDISILNNSDADRGGGAIKITKPTIIDVDPENDSNED